ncbi:MAG: hypothetical protein GF332_01745 [Candidatus Moranbacteria bacterium]|nr:hypothetical protein [Candidatus Moranbacteria bacterium]
MLIIIKILKYMILAGIFGAGVAFTIASVRSPKYQSDFTAMVVQKNWDKDAALNQQIIERALNISQPLIKSDYFIQAVEKNNQENPKFDLNNINQKQWRQAIFVIPNSQQKTIKVVASDNQPERALWIAGEIAFNLKHILTEFTDPEKIELKIIQQPEQGKAFDYLNLIEPTSMGGILGAALGLVIFLLFGPGLEKIINTQTMSINSAQRLDKNLNLPKERLNAYPVADSRGYQSHPTQAQAVKKQQTPISQPPAQNLQNSGFKSSMPSSQNYRQRFQQEADQINAGYVKSFKQSKQRAAQQMAQKGRLTPLNQPYKTTSSNDYPSVNQKPNQEPIATSDSNQSFKSREPSEADEEEIKARLNRLIHG